MSSFGQHRSDIEAMAAREAMNFVPLYILLEKKGGK